MAAVVPIMLAHVLIYMELNQKRKGVVFRLVLSVVHTFPLPQKPFQYLKSFGLVFVNSLQWPLSQPAQLQIVAYHEHDMLEQESSLVKGIGR